MTLIDRLKAATGPDRELDAAIGIVAGINFAQQHAYDGSITYGRIDSEGDRSVPSANSDNYMLVKPYTASIDAALALVERMLPGALWRVEKCATPFLHPGCDYWASAGIAGEQESTYSKTAPLAILTALFTALQGKDATE